MEITINNLYNSTRIFIDYYVDFSTTGNNRYTAQKYIMTAIALFVLSAAG